ncbi:MAG: IS91 family transposase [Thiotrichales bacterium]|nr:IS91 family transposase [Thiotrichales bacterium]
MTDHFVFARIIERFMPGLKQQQRISPEQAATCQNILNCHTPALGGLDYACNNCGLHYPRYHSCRHRHCPQCQQSASERWVERREQDLLPVPYYHLVFTLPHVLNGWAQLHPEVIYQRLFRCVWECLDDYSRNNRQLEGKLGMTAVLHTWGQNLNQHIHLHCLIPGGAVDEQGRFVATRRDFLYPQRVLAKLLRGKMVGALRRDWNTGQLQRIAADQIDLILDELMQTDWVIHTRAHLRQPDIVLRYLARYTHRTAISLSRIESVDSSSVRFRWKDYRDNRTKSMTLPGEEFLRRFLLHVLPKGLMRIRHYGYLANRVRVKELKKIRDALAPCDHRETESREPRSVPAEQARCPKCKPGYLRLVGEILPERQRRRYALILSS